MAEGGGGAGGVGGAGGLSSPAISGQQADISDFDKAFVSALEHAFSTSRKDGGGGPMMGEPQGQVTNITMNVRMS